MGRLFTCAAYLLVAVLLACLLFALYALLRGPSGSPFGG